MRADHHLTAYQRIFFSQTNRAAAKKATLLNRAVWRVLHAAAWGKPLDIGLPDEGGATAGGRFGTTVDTTESSSPICEPREEDTKQERRLKKRSTHWPKKRRVCVWWIQSFTYWHSGA